MQVNNCANKQKGVYQTQDALHNVTYKGTLQFNVTDGGFGEAVVIYLFVTHEFSIGQ